MSSTSTKNLYEGFHTNQLMLYQHELGDEIIPAYTIFLPAYMKMKVKNIVSLDVQKLQMQLNCTVSLTVYYGNLPSQIVQYIEHNIYLIVEGDKSIHLFSHELDDNIQFKNNDQDKSFNYVVRKHLPVTNIHPYLFFTPYQIIDCILSINVRIRHLLHNCPVVYFKVNLMDSGDGYDDKFLYAKELGVRNYGFAEKRRHVEFTTNSEPRSLIEFDKNIYNWECLKNQDDEDDLNIEKNEHIEEFRVAHFHFPLYKFTTATLGTIFLPLFILTLINLCIFYQSWELNERIANIAMLMIAFLALIPVMHSQMPLPKLTLLEICLYLELSTTILCLIDSVQIVENFTEEEYDFVPMQDPFFCACLIISSVIFGLFFILYCVNLLVWRKNHRDYKKFGKFNKVPVDREAWNKNFLCNQAFALLANKLLLEQTQTLDFLQEIGKMKLESTQLSYVQL